MKIIPLAFDSFSTRSVATFVDTKGCKILIDPGISIAPIRYGLEPHPTEVRRLLDGWNLIKKYIKVADVMILTHYHYDHYNPSEPELWKGKKARVKHPTENINISQKGRAAEFLPKIQNIAEVEYSDGKEWEFGKTKLTFSKAVPHGPATRLGYVTEVMIEEGSECFIHTSDIEGPCLKEHTEFILKGNPSTLFVDGPLSYIMYRYGLKAMQNSVDNLIEIVKKTDVEKLVIDHHFLRDLKWKERVKDVFAAAEKKGIFFGSAAGFLDRKDELLEANRKELFKTHPAKATAGGEIAKFIGEE